jgi:hypothetical protein
MTPDHRDTLIARVYQVTADETELHARLTDGAPLEAWLELDAIHQAFQDHLVEILREVMQA